MCKGPSVEGCIVFLHISKKTDLLGFVGIDFPAGCAILSLLLRYAALSCFYLGEIVHLRGNAQCCYAPFRVEPMPACNAG